MIADKPMKRTKSIAILLVAVLALSMASCARQPSNKRSAKLIQHHFKKYAKKYPETVYGKYHVKEVEVTGQQEIHKYLIAVEAFITLGDGSVQRVRATLERGPVGWRFISWENATNM